METVQKKGLTPLQKQLSFQMYLVLIVGWIVSALLDQPMLMISFLVVGWMIAIFTIARTPMGYWNIARGVIAMGVFMYLYHRFVGPWMFGRPS